MKWLPSLTRWRLIPWRPLQKEDLEKRAALGVPCGLIVGTPKGIAWYHGLHLPTHVIVADVWDKNFFEIDMFLDAHYGLMSVHKIALRRGEK